MRACHVSFSHDLREFQKELEEAVQDGSDAANEESRVDQSLQDQGWLK